jgi:hypothetical protein
MPALSRVRDQQLLATLEHAANNVPYYRRKWGARWKRVRSVRDLHLLPLLTKEEAIANQRELLAGTPGAYGGTISSGTMHGDRAPLRVLHTDSETRALDELYAGFPAAKEPRRPRGFVLEVRAMHHGLPEGQPPHGRIRVPWTYTANALRLIRELLANRQPDRSRAIALNIGAGALMALTAWFSERGEDPARFRLIEISTYGRKLSPTWREHIERAWEAPIYDNFSLSEFRTPATECEACGWFHWGDPPLHFEVVDHALVLTGLYPFVQAMPLIRYSTGDCVELGPRCATASERGFRFRGRVSQTVFDSNGRPIVTGQDIQDFLESQPLVAREPHHCNQLGLVKSPDIGAVKYTLDVKRRHVQVEVRCDPVVFPGVVETAWFPQHGLSVELVPPGTLGPPPSKLL